LPLFRIGLVNVDGKHTYLIFDMHHIISDGVSHTILQEDFFNLIQSKELKVKKFQYKDYSEWQNSEKVKQQLEKQREFWINELPKGNIPKLNLLSESKMFSNDNFEGKSIYFTIERETTELLKKVIEENEVTLYMFLLSIYKILLFKYTAQNDIIIGTVVAGRNQFDMQQIIGAFVNVLVIRSHPNENKKYIEFLNEIKIKVLDVFDNQDYQYDEIIRGLNMSPTLKQDPLVEAQFTIQNFTDYKNSDSIENSLSIKLYKNKISKWILDLIAFEMNDQHIVLRLNYSTALFEESSANQFAKHFIEIVNQVINNIEVEIGNVKLSHDYVYAEQISELDQGDFVL
jgi:hypothetical protein